YFAGEIDNSLKDSWRREPQKLVEWVRNNINAADELNPQRIPMRPSGVWKARIADRHSRDIFFVSLARSLGIPARIEPVTRKVQYHTSDWTDVEFDEAEASLASQGTLKVSYKPTPSLDNPKYYSHFTIAKIQPDATLQTLNFEATAQTDMGDGDTWRGLMSKPLSIDEGNYLLVSGMRMASGKVLARTSFFTVKKGESTEIELVVRNDEEDVRILGSIDAEKTFVKEDGSHSSLLNAVGRGYFVAGILGARQEPTNHALKDIALFHDEFEKWERGIVLLFASEQGFELYDRKEFPGLPSTVTYGTDKDGEIAKMLREAMKLSDERSLPIFVIADTFGRVVFVSQGYTIGLGEQMLKVIRKL
ncbi:MAG: transglutaminase-like domain-containing protein, partial [Tannerella sp.]|nr:transglutaminase-like domain-containing protein [Tannerella sp.]